MSKITKALIPAGGYGTRFLPATKSIPKEMFPLGNKPIVLHVVEELVAAGIKDIIFVVSHHKQAIESFFSANQVLEQYFSELGKQQEVDNLRRISEMANFSYVYTKPPYGNGGCLYSAKHLLWNDPFILVWSDEVMLTKGKNRVAQCLETFEKFNKPVVSAVRIAEPEHRQRYGMAELKDLEGDVKEIVRIVEKPQPGTEPSEYATHGAYVLTPQVFDALDETQPGANGELWLTDVLNKMMPKTGLLAKIIPDAHYLDCGNPIEYLFSQIDYALSYTDNSKAVDDFIANRTYCRRPQ